MLKRLRSECIVHLDITTDGPLLIKSGRTFATGVDMTAVRTLRGGKWEVYIPGSSLKGAIRSQSERIARTLSSQGCCDPFGNHSCSEVLNDFRNQNDSLPAATAYRLSCAICKLFGSLSQAGRLSFNDAHTNSRIDHKNLPIRNNVAINRRTGGAAGTALFDMEVVPTGTHFQTSFYLRNFELWQLGLLGFVLRDFEEGTIKLGLGKSRGLGQVRANTTKLEVRYLGLYPQPEPSSLCELRGLKNLEPDEPYGFAEENEPLPVYGNPAPPDAVGAIADEYGLRTIYRFESSSQLRHLWTKVAPLWVAYIRSNRPPTEN